MLRYMCSSFLVLLSAYGLGGCATSHQITSGNSNMCINVVNHGSPEPGAPIIMKGCDPWRNQQWTLNSNGTITGIGGFCVDVQGSAPKDGAKVIYTPCSGSPSQNWVSSQGMITGIGGKCLDIDYSDPGAPLIIATCNASPSQQWVSR